jgi:hypothetical protein
VREPSRPIHDSKRRKMVANEALNGLYKRAQILPRRKCSMAKIQSQILATIKKKVRNFLN